MKQGKYKMETPTLADKVRGVINPPKGEPEALVMIRIIEGLGWYRAMFGRQPIMFHQDFQGKAVMIIADYLQGKYKYERR